MTAMGHSPTQRQAAFGHRFTLGGIVSLPELIGWLTVAVAVELLVLRTFTRITIHIPGLGAAAGPIEALSEGGRFAFYTATVLAIVAAIALMQVAWQTASVGGRVIAASLAVLLGAAGALRTGPGLGEEAALNTVLLAALTLTGIGAAILSGPRLGAAILAATAAAGLAGAYSVSQMWAGEGMGRGLPAEVLDAAEATAIVFAVMLPWATNTIPSPRRLPLAAGAAAAFVTLALLLGSPSTSRFLLLWTHGLTGSLPSVVYAVAAGCLVFAAAAMWQRGEAIGGLGILLVVAGGVAMQNTYQTMLVAVGLACLGMAGVVCGARRDRERQPLEVPDRVQRSACEE